MARRFIPLALLAALAIGGCSTGESADVTADQRQARLELIRAARDYDNHELARLCRGLFPDDFLTSDDYPREDEDHRTPTETEEIRTLVARAGCDVPAPE